MMSAEVDSPADTELRTVRSMEWRQQSTSNKSNNPVSVGAEEIELGNLDSSERLEKNNQQKDEKHGELDKTTGKNIVIALSSFVAKKPTQLSFAKGDTIEVVSTTGKWHRGILRKSSNYSITNEILSYPPNFCQPSSVLNRNLETALNWMSDSVGEIKDRANKSVPLKTSTLVQATDGPKVVKARSSFTARKPTQMSFEKGDLIEVISEKGTWHLGMLKQSETHEITGKQLLYPPNFVLNSHL
jgi:hypothetical protein